MEIVFTTDSIKFANGTLNIRERHEPGMTISFTDIPRGIDVLIKDTKMHKIDDLSVLISITDTSEYFYDHQNILRKKITIRFKSEDKHDMFYEKYEDMKKKMENFKYYPNGTLKSRENNDRYEEYYNMPGYVLKYAGSVDDNDNYISGTFFNPKQNIQIDFGEFEDNIPKGECTVFFYDNLGEEIAYHDLTLDDYTEKEFNVDKFAQLNVPTYNKILCKTEPIEDILYKLLKEINTLHEEIKSLRETNSRRTGWFY